MEANIETLARFEFKLEEDEKCVPLERRLVCGRVGRATLVKDEELVDEENGAFLYIP